MKNYLKDGYKHTNTLTKIVALTIVFFFVFYAFDLFFDNFDARSPILFQWPVVKRYENRLKVEPLPTRKPTPKPTKPKTERELIMTKKHGEILWKIYGLESTWGKNDICRPTKFAGFGVMNEEQVICYDTFEKAVDRAEYWLTNLGVDKDLATALCTWNTGIRQPNCFYYQNYLSL